MVLIQSFLAAVKWTLALYIILIFLFSAGFTHVSPLALSVLGFVVMFIMFLLDNIDLRY